MSASEILWPRCGHCNRAADVSPDADGKLIARCRACSTEPVEVVAAFVIPSRLAWSRELVTVFRQKVENPDDQRRTYLAKRKKKAVRHGR